MSSFQYSSSIFKFRNSEWCLLHRSEPFEFRNLSCQTDEADAEKRDPDKLLSAFLKFSTFYLQIIIPVCFLSICHFPCHYLK